MFFIRLSKLLSSHTHLIRRDCKKFYSEDLVFKKEIFDFVKKYEERTIQSKYYALPKLKSPKEEDSSDYLINEATIRAIGGKGGDGSAYLHSKHCKEFAGPLGGNGGNGGHVVFHATSKVSSLNHLTEQIKAENGRGELIMGKHGRSGRDKWVNVPIGTSIFKKGRPDAVLNDEGTLFIAARGGAGGKGNMFFTSSTNQAPKFAEKGPPGESIVYDIKMRTMAHVGLVGFPNAGKSSFLRAISRARPLVSQVAFSTTSPKVGVIEYEDFAQVKVADIPGLIEGSHKNEGLGIEFLLHISKCNALLYVIDLSEDDPIKHLNILRAELEAYEEGLSQRPAAIIANKVDVPRSQDSLEVLVKHADLPVIPISAKHHLNLNPVLSLIRFISELTETKYLPIRI